MLYLRLQLFLVAANFVLLGSGHHERFKLLLFAIRRASLLLFGSMLELFLAFLDLLLFSLEFSLGHLVVCYRAGVYKSMRVLIIGLDLIIFFIIIRHLRFLFGCWLCVLAFFRLFDLFGLLDSLGFFLELYLLLAIPVDLAFLRFFLLLLLILILSFLLLYLF